jgi:hypothetical protein
VSTEIEVATPAQVPSAQVASATEEFRAAEHELIVATVRTTLIATPICVVVMVGIAALALAFANTGNSAAMLPVAAGIGVIAGVFFGGLMAFLFKAEHLEELTRKQAHGARP